MPQRVRRLVVGLGLRVTLGLHPGQVGLDLAGDGRLGPAEHAAHQLGDLLGAVDAAVRVLDRDAGPPGEHVVQVQRALVVRPVHDLDLQVVRCGRQRLEQFGVVLGEPEHLVDQRAVAVQQVPDPVRMQPVAGAELVGLVDQGVVAVRTEQRDLVGDGGLQPAGQVDACRVHRIRGHHPVGGVLAARDRDQAGRDPGHGVLAGELRGLLALAGQQRPQARVHALDVGVRQRRGEHRVDVVEDVVDVVLGRGRVRQVEVPVGVGRANDPMIAPRDHEQHGLLGAQDQAGLGHDPVPRHHDVHALAGAHPEPAPAAGQVLQIVGPHPGAVDHDTGLHLGLVAVLHVAHAHAGDPVRLLEEPDDLGRGPHHRAVVRGRARHGQRVPGVVGLGVEISNAADQRAPLERGKHPQRRRPGQVLLAGHRPRATHAVVEHQAGRGVGPLPEAVLERVQEAHRLDQVWRETREHQLTFAQRLPDQTELELLQVAQTAVKQLAGAARRTRGEVTCLDEGDPQAARCRVQRRADADHATADDHHVELLAAQSLPRLCAFGHPEAAAEGLCVLRCDWFAAGHRTCPSFWRLPRPRYPENGRVRR